MKGLIPQGHYGIPESDEEIIDLGPSVDLFPLARRPKAIDMTDMEALVISYDMESDGVQADSRQVGRVRFALPVRPQLPRLRAEHWSVPGVLLRQQVEPHRGEEAVSLPAADPGGHRRQGGGR